MVATTLVCARRESAKRRYDLQSPGSSTVLTTEHVHRTSQTIIHNSLHRNAACCKFPRTSANTNASLRAPAHSLAMPLTTHCMRHVSNTIREHNSKPSLILLSEIATHSISICILSKVSCRGSQSALTSIAKHRHALPCHRHEHLEQRKIQSHRIYCTKRGALISIACNAACHQFFAPCVARARLLSFITLSIFPSVFASSPLPPRRVYLIPTDKRSRLCSSATIDSAAMIHPKLATRSHVPNPTAAHSFSCRRFCVDAFSCPLHDLRSSLQAEHHPWLFASTRHGAKAPCCEFS